jgi:hypothetical protein
MAPDVVARRPDPGPVQDRYGLVLLLLVGSFLLSAFVTRAWARVLPLALYLIALLFALRGRGAAGRVRAWLRWVSVTGSVAAGVAVVLVANHVVRGLVSLWLAVVLTVAIVVVVRRILVEHRVVTLQTIFGALSAYLLIGFTFAALFSAVAQFENGPLFINHHPATSDTIQYFSFVTMTTVGYGDFAVAGEPARTLAVLDALTGQLFLVTLVARLVSLFGAHRDEHEPQ